MINSGVLGFSDVVSHRIIPRDEPENIGSVLLFEMMMVVVALILLNLLIAIMNSAYESVRLAATLEALYEKSLIILDIERLTLPTLMRWFKIEPHIVFPK